MPFPFHIQESFSFIIPDTAFSGKKDRMGKFVGSVFRGRSLILASADIPHEPFPADIGPVAGIPYIVVCGAGIAFKQFVQSPEPPATSPSAL
jgi:hypothetical protein